MMIRTNAGYVITNSINVGNTEFVLGVHMNTPNQFVTWQCKDGDNYFWGHYFSDRLKAQKDLCERGLDEVRILENNKKSKTKDKER